MIIRSSGATVARWVLAAGVEAALAGLIVGLLELSLIASRSSLGGGALLAAAPVVVGITLLPVLLVGIPGALVIRLLARHPVVATALAGLHAPGRRRIEVLVAGAVALIGLAIVWWFGFRVVAHVHRTYNEPNGAGILATTLTLGAGAVVAVVATAVAPPLARRAGGWALADRLTRGRVAVWLAIAFAVAAAVVLHVVVRRIAPAWDPWPTYVQGSVGIALLGAVLLEPARRVGARGAIASLAVAVTLVGVAFTRIGDAPATRGAIVTTGTVSWIGLGGAQRLTDRDGDGFSASFGGDDCDDTNPDVRPGAREVPGNGRDDNCLGGDATLSSIARRLRPTPSATPEAPRRDVILVTIDALRPDHTSAYGYARPTTPNLAALAARGALFLRAESPATLTRRALPSILFGRYASTLPFRLDAVYAQLDDNDLPTLASTLDRADWNTHACISNHGLLGPPALNGFAGVTAASRLEVSENTDNADVVATRAIAWLAEQPANRPRFLWIHFIDPHYPYAPPAGAPHFGAGAIDAYDAEIAFTDVALGRLIAAIATAGRADRTIIAVTADHGEGFGEHGDYFHGRSLYEDQTHVPLVIAVPGATPRVIPEPVSLVDLAPTLLDLVGLAAPAGMNGVSLAPAILGAGKVPAHDVIAELLSDREIDRTAVSAYFGDWKVIRDLKAATTEIYDLADDPHERHDRTDRADALVPQLAAAVDRELSTLPPDGGDEAGVSHDPAMGPPERTGLPPSR